MSKLPLVSPVLKPTWTESKSHCIPVKTAPAPPVKPAETPAPKDVTLDVTPKPTEAAPTPPPDGDEVTDPEIVNNGANIPVPLPFKPVSPMDVLASSNPQVLTVMLRQLHDMKGPMPNTSDGALKVINHLTESFKHGTDVTKYADEVALHLTGRNERREVIAELSDVVDDERLNEIFTTRAKFEDFMHACQRRSDVSITESIAMQAYFSVEADKIFAKRMKKSSGDAGAGRDPNEMLLKANLPDHLHRKQLQSKFNEASPQEREILRKLGFKIQQSMLATKITRTTTTETVELAPEAKVHG